jgi:hypothetical protein
MKYIITESRLEENILYYINKIFDVNDINWTYRYDYDDDGFEHEDENQIVFYVGDYNGEDDGCFYWYSCDYFNTNSKAGEKCPLVSVEIEYKKQLDGYFGDLWYGPFKKWFKEHFELPVKTID